MLEARTFTPDSLSVALAKCEITAAEKQLLRVHGVFQQKQTAASARDIKEEVSRGKLRDLKTGQLLNVKIKTSEKLENFDECVLEGNLEEWIPKTPNSEIKISLYFNVHRVVSKGKYKLTEKEIKIVEKKIELIDLCYHKIHKNVTSILIDLLEHNQQPQIALIYGSTSYTWKDIEASSKGMNKKYKFIPCGVNLFDPQDIIKSLKELDAEEKYHLICLYRGGGNGLEIFNDLNVAECAIHLKTPFVTAIGHALDNPFLQMIADRVFETPTAFGSYLNKCARDAFTVSKRLEESEQTIKHLNRQNADWLSTFKELSGGISHKHNENKKLINASRNLITNLLKSVLDALAGKKHRSQPVVTSSLPATPNNIGAKSLAGRHENSSFQLTAFTTSGFLAGVLAGIIFSLFYNLSALIQNPPVNVENNNSNVNAVSQTNTGNFPSQPNANFNSMANRSNRPALK
jgi:hypothetical protein